MRLVDVPLRDLACQLIDVVTPYHSNDCSQRVKIPVLHWQSGGLLTDLLPPSLEVLRVGLLDRQKEGAGGLGPGDRVLRGGLVGDLAHDPANVGPLDEVVVMDVEVEPAR